LEEVLAVRTGSVEKLLDVFLSSISFPINCAVRNFILFRIGPSSKIFKKCGAPKLCKQEQVVEGSELTEESTALFHTLINTCVENLIVQKHFFASSA